MQKELETEEENDSLMTLWLFQCTLQNLHYTDIKTDSAGMLYILQISKFGVMNRW